MSVHAGEDYAVRIDPISFAGDCVAPGAHYHLDRTPDSLPAGLIATKPRSSLWITRLEVSPLQQSTGSLVIIVFAQQSHSPLLKC
jgi:hypothetical protein